MSHLPGCLACKSTEIRKCGNNGSAGSTLGPAWFEAIGFMHTEMRLSRNPGIFRSFKTASLKLSFSSMLLYLKFSYRYSFTCSDPDQVDARVKL